MNALINNLNESGFVRWLGELTWGFPGAEILHLICLTTFLGTIVLVDFRLIGVAKSIPLSRFLEPVLVINRRAFFGVFLTGLVLCLFMPLEYSTNSAFLVKMCLIIVAGLNALLMHRYLLIDLKKWDVDVVPPLLVRLSAFVSLMLWVAVLACGRLIAYFYNFGY